MKNLNWRDLLRQHTLFENLDPTEVERIIAQLLDDKVSDEREYSADKIIVREGESGASVFLVGQGSVQVLLEEENAADTPIAVLRRGEFFGEMALLEKKPRAATVKAKESCVLLEIRGQDFLKLLDEHKDVESKMLLKLSERLRHANDQVLAVRVRGVDDKIDALKVRHEAELKAVDAQLKAALAIFDQTKLRTDEIINSAERSRTRLTGAVSAIATIIVVMTTFLGWIGLSQFKDASEIKKLAGEARTDAEQIKNATKDLQNTSAGLKEFAEFRREFYQQVMVPLFSDQVEKDTELAQRYYKLILETQDDLINNELFRALWAKILGNADKRDYYKQILQFGINIDLKSPRQKFLSYYLLLIALILDDNHSEFDKTLQKLKEYTNGYKGGAIRETIKVDFGIETFKNFPADRQSSIVKVWNLIP